MSSAINEIDMEFKEIKNVNIETIGSLSQITRPCPIKYKSMKAQHEQVEVTWYYSNTPRSTGKRYFIFIGFVILVYIYLLIRKITK
jgi:hypothetical protein